MYIVYIYTYIYIYIYAVIYAVTYTMYIYTVYIFLQFFYIFKVGLSPSKKICVICLIESPLKMMRNAFYFMLKALFVIKIFKFLSRLFGSDGKTA